MIQGFLLYTMEYFDIVDEKGIPTGETVERTVAHAQGIRHRTAHLWILRKGLSGTEVLLQKRTMTKDSFPGCYDISSAGHMPAGSDYIESALRELKEELGLEANPKDFIFCGDKTASRDTEFYGKEFHDREYCRVFALWRDVKDNEFTFQAEEVSGVIWMNLDECIEAVRENRIPHCIFLEELLMLKTAIE